MNHCCNPASLPIAPPASTRSVYPAWPALLRLIRIISPATVDFTQMLYTDRPTTGSSPRTTLTHYR